MGFLQRDAGAEIFMRGKEKAGLGRTYTSQACPVSIGERSSGGKRNFYRSFEGALLRKRAAGRSDKGGKTRKKASQAKRQGI